MMSSDLKVLLPEWATNIFLTFNFVQPLLLAVGVILLTRFAVGFVSRVTRRALTPLDPTIRKFLIQVAEFLTVAIGVIAFLSVWGVETSSAIAVLGAAGLAIGLALQNTLSHFAAGIMLINFRPFQVGDFIEGAGVSGVVDSIGLFSTTLVSRDNVKITVPNGNLFSGTLKNTTALGTRRVDLEVDIGDRPIEPTITLLLSVVQPHPLVLDRPETTCHVSSITPTSTILYVRPWCSAEVYEHVRSQVQQAIKEALKEQLS